MNENPDILNSKIKPQKQVNHLAIDLTLPKVLQGGCHTA